jgi:hypothetical protein
MRSLPPGGPATKTALIRDGHARSKRDRRRGTRRGRQLASMAPSCSGPIGSRPGRLAAFWKAEIEKWWPIIEAADIKGE